MHRSVLFGGFLGEPKGNTSSPGSSDTPVCWAEKFGVAMAAGLEFAERPDAEASQIDPYGFPCGFPCNHVNKRCLQQKHTHTNCGGAPRWVRYQLALAITKHGRCRVSKNQAYASSHPTWKTSFLLCGFPTKGLLPPWRIPAKRRAARSMRAKASRRPEQSGPDVTVWSLTAN